MLTISPATRKIIELAIEEDLICSDVTTDAIFDGSEMSEAYLIAKQDLVLCGTAIFALIFDYMQKATLPALADVNIVFHAKDGDRIAKGTKFAEIQGPTYILLKAERVALNFIQHLSGIATQARRMVELLGERISVANTRKTAPGMRELQHYAVRTGGAKSHRFNLGSGVMIKDNHIAAAGSIENAVKKARAFAPHTLKIEVEVKDLDECAQALAAGADIIMLDNMDVETMKEAVRRIDKKALVEVSGNVTIENAARLRMLDIDIVSSGALTHSVTAADISLRFVEP